MTFDFVLSQYFEVERSVFCPLANTVGLDPWESDAFFQTAALVRSLRKLVDEDRRRLCLTIDDLFVMPMKAIAATLFEAVEEFGQHLHQYFECQRKYLVGSIQRMYGPEIRRDIEKRIVRVLQSGKSPALAQFILLSGRLECEARGRTRLFERIVYKRYRAHRHIVDRCCLAQVREVRTSAFNEAYVPKDSR